ncbi:MAG: hypothetical protein M3Y75_14195 [Actinomycetota bacterium]|nr:hypothetical protein [Actinomycetota bacterium]
MSSGINISGRQRNLLYEPTLDFLSVADDSYLAAVHGRYEKADWLGRQTCEELTFVLDDLRWGERQLGEGEAQELRLAREDVLGRSAVCECGTIAAMAGSNR